MSALTTIIMQALAAALAIGLLIAFFPRILAAVRKKGGDAPPESEGRRVTTALVTAVLATFVGGWCAGRGVGFLGSGTPPCPGVSDPMIPAQAQQAFTCGETLLDFTAVSHGNYDVQFLDIEVNGRAAPGGPLAAIYPEVRAHRNKLDDLSRGRIVAKVWVDPADPAGYPKLGFRPGINYIWIDGNVGEPRDTLIRSIDLRAAPADTIPGFGITADTLRGEVGRAGMLRAVVIPSDGTPPAVIPVDYYDHEHSDVFAHHNHSIARWIFWPNDVGGWMECAKHGCCSMGDL